MKVMSFGEILLRLSAPGYTKLFQNDTMDISFCGGEANVAVSLANFGLDSVFLTKVPGNAIGIAAINSMRYFGVDTSLVKYGEGRLGLYYLEKGASQRPSKIIYDRKASVFSLANKEEFEWNELFKDISWFHWTGITPALSENMAEACLEACKCAKSLGIRISCDLNYRKTLWDSEKAGRVMEKMMPYVDVCIANEEDAEKVLGIKAENTDIASGKIDKSKYKAVAEKICEKYNCKYVAFTLRESYSASRNGWSGILYNADKRKTYYSNRYDIALVDRVGGGDSFAAALIYGLIKDKSPDDIIQFATAASCLKQTMEGDYNRATVEDVETLIQYGESGRVQR